MLDAGGVGFAPPLRFLWCLIQNIVEENLIGLIVHGTLWLAIIIEEKGKEMANLDTRVLAFVRGGEEWGVNNTKGSRWNKNGEKSDASEESQFQVRA